MQSLLRVFGKELRWRAVWPGALVSLGVAVLVGVVGGSFVQEGSTTAYAVNAFLFAGLIVGGMMGATRSLSSPLLAAVSTAAPVMVLAIVVQLIRRLSTGDAIAPLGIPLVLLLTASLASLGGLIGVRWSRKHQSLLAPDSGARSRKS